MSIEKADLETRPILFVYDIDGTVIPRWGATADEKIKGRGGLIALGNGLRAEKSRRQKLGLPRLYAGPATGNVLGALEKLGDPATPDGAIFKGAVLLEMDFAITGVGSHIAWRNTQTGKLDRDESWPPPNPLWKPKGIRKFLDKRPGMSPQSEDAQDYAKISYMAHDVTDTIRYSQALAKVLLDEGYPAQVIISGPADESKYCDILPPGVEKGTGTTHVQSRVAGEYGGIMPITACAVDSMNDRGLVKVADYIILPKNAEPEFREWTLSEATGHVYEAKQDVAYGVLEGLAYAGICRVA